MAFLLRCPACRVKFKWDVSKGFPDYCPNEECETRIAHDRDDDDIVVPWIRSSATTANDQVYRDIERASERRVEMAAERAGVPTSEMSDLKITDLRETRHEGAVAAVPVNNAVTQFMNQNPGVRGFSNNGVGYSGAVMSGPEPNRGARMQTAIRRMHGDGMASIGIHGVVGDRPAIETQNPAYRRRV